MYLTIRDLLDLPSKQGFQLLCGEAGLNNQVASAGILDYEFSDDVSFNRDDVFSPDSFVITSLLFAHNAPEKILPAVDQLIRHGVSGLGIKTVVFKDLPAAVIDYADKAAFPIFLFPDEAYFENIIYEIMHRVNLNDQLLELEQNVEKLLFQPLSGQQIGAIVRQLFPSSKPFCRAVFVSLINPSAFSFASLHNNYSRSPADKTRTRLLRYADQLVVISQHDTDDGALFDVILQEVLRHCRLPDDSYRLAISQILPLRDLDQTVQQAHITATANRVEQQARVKYADIGLYQLLVPLKDQPAALTFKQTILQPILGDQELFQTAIAYVLANGDVELAAQQLHCHKNTIRYRLTKIKERINPDQPDWQFGQILSIAIKLYLLDQS